MECSRRPTTPTSTAGTRLIRWSVRAQLLKTQGKGSDNAMQKGVAGTGSQWKMQIGATQCRAQCVVAGTGSATTYLVRSSGTVADGLWHKVLCQRSGTTLSAYVDDALKGTTTIPSILNPFVGRRTAHRPIWFRPCPQTTARTIWWS